MTCSSSGRRPELRVHKASARAAPGAARTRGARADQSATRPARGHGQQLAQRPERRLGARYGRTLLMAAGATGGGPVGLRWPCAGGALVGCAIGGWRPSAAGGRVDGGRRAAAGVVQPGSRHHQCAGGVRCRRPVGDDGCAPGSGGLLCRYRLGAAARGRARAALAGGWRCGDGAGRGEPGDCWPGRLAAAHALGSSWIHRPGRLAAAEPGGGSRPRRRCCGPLPARVPVQCCSRCWCGSAWS